MLEVGCVYFDKEMSKRKGADVYYLVYAIENDYAFVAYSDSSGWTIGNRYCILLGIKFGFWVIPNKLPVNRNDKYIGKLSDTQFMNYTVLNAAYHYFPTGICINLDEDGQKERDELLVNWFENHMNIISQISQTTLDTLNRLKSLQLKIQEYK